jgi:hypothetical protein
MKFSKTLLAIIFALSAAYSFAQTKTLILPRPTPIPPPGNIKLLPEYVHERKQGIDTDVGLISKKDGLSIRYDIGDLAGNYAIRAQEREKQNLLWYRWQEVNGQRLLITHLKDGTIYASFYETRANFISIVKTNEELVDFLMMIMTYGYKEKTNNKKPLKQQ